MRVTSMLRSTDVLTRAARAMARETAKGGAVTQEAEEGIRDELVRAAAMQMFRKADTDGSGTLSKAEFEAALSFKALNRNMDNVIDQAEFIQAYTSSRRRVVNKDALEAAATREVAKAAAMPAAGAETSVAVITGRQYALLAFKGALPFVAFGFVDNFIMIVAGDAIEASIGVALSLSTMAAAGLGNAFSDVVGIAASDRIEGLIERMGLPAVGLTAVQLMSPGARRVNVISQMGGILLGCILGMCPLLWMDQEKKALQGAFEDADSDGNGHLTGAEIDRALHRYGLMIKPDEVKWLVRRCDLDHSGALEIDEFVRLVKHWNEFNEEYQSARKANGGRDLMGSTDLALAP